MRGRWRADLRRFFFQQVYIAGPGEVAGDTHCWGDGFAHVHCQGWFVCYGAQIYLGDIVRGVCHLDEGSFAHCRSGLPVVDHLAASFATA